MTKVAAFRWQEVVGILLCMVTARSFAMAWNRLADRKIDAANPRTAGRHLPARILSVPQVATFAAVCAAGFIASTLLCFSRTACRCIFRSPCSRSSPATATPNDSRPSPIFGWAPHSPSHPSPPGSRFAASACIANALRPLPALVLGGAVLTWVAGFDIIYACQDYESDRAAGSTAYPSPSAFAARCGSPPPATCSRSCCWPACRSCTRSSAGSFGSALPQSPCY